MKIETRFLVLAALVVGILVSGSAAGGATASVGDTYSWSAGQTDTWEIPDGTKEIKITMSSGEGGDGGDGAEGNYAGGSGGSGLSGTYTLPISDTSKTLEIGVGAKGSSGSGGSANAYGGGGGGGGGETSIRWQSSQEVIVCQEGGGGGGGGGGTTYGGGDGGPGGDANGDGGQDSEAGQSSGGSGGTGYFQQSGCNLGGPAGSGGSTYSGGGDGSAGSSSTSSSITTQSTGTNTGDGSLTIEITEANKAPTFNSTSIEPEPPLVGENVSYSADVYDPDGNIDYTNLTLKFDGSTVISDLKRAGTDTPNWNDVYVPDSIGTLNATFETVDDKGAVNTTSLVKEVQFNGSADFNYVISNNWTNEEGSSNQINNTGSLIKLDRKWENLHTYGCNGNDRCPEVDWGTSYTVVNTTSVTIPSYADRLRLWNGGVELYSGSGNKQYSARLYDSTNNYQIDEGSAGGFIDSVQLDGSISNTGSVSIEVQGKEVDGGYSGNIDGGSTIDARVPYSSGSYTTSWIENPAGTKEFRRLTVNFSSISGTENVTIEVSDDGSNVKDSMEFSTSEDIREVISSISDGDYFRVKFEIDSSATEVDKVNVTGDSNNAQPFLENQTFSLDNKNDIERLLFDIDDRSEKDIATYSGSGTENIFSNSSLKLDINIPKTDSYSISDFSGVSSNSVDVDLSKSDSGLGEDSSHGHGLDDQQIEKEITISNNNQGAIGYELVMENFGTIIQGETWSGSISGSNSITHKGIWGGDWVTGETESTYDRYSDSDYNHGEDQQRIHNRTQLVADNSRSFSFTGVDLSGVCSETTSADVASGTGVEVTTDCNRPTFLVDKITQSTGSEYEDSSYSHDLDAQGVAKEKNLTESSGSFNFNQVNISAPSISGSCSNCGQRQRDISAGATITEVYNATSDFISNEVESTFSKYSDSGYDHGEDQQRIVNQTQLDVDNEKSLTFHSVDISGKCSQVTSSDVPSGSSTLTTDCNRPTFLVDTVSQTVTGLQEDSTEQHDLSTQHGYKRKDLAENDGYSYSQIDISAPSLPGSCETCNGRTRDIAASTTISEYYNSSSDWITGETESTYTKYSDSDHNHTEDGQRIHNRTELLVDNSRSFTFHNVDLPSICSQTASADISPATGFQATNDCNRPTFNLDVLTTSVGSLKEDTGKNHGLNTQYVKKNKTVSEIGGYSWSNVDIFAPSIEGSCNDCSGTRTRDISSTDSVTETYHASADWISGETENDYNEVGENPSASHTLDTQYNLWETELVVDNFQDFGFTSVDLSSQCGNTASADIPSGTGVQVTTNCSTVERLGDFITGEAEETFDKYSDSDFDHTEDQQRIHNRTKLLVDNPKPYGYSSVDLSSTCSGTTSADIASGTGVEATTDCNRPVFTVDYISESVGGEFVDTSYSHSLDTQGLAVYKNISETSGYSFNQVNVSAPAFDGTCVNCGERTTDISANGDVSLTYNSTGDWISGENRTTYTRYSAPGFNHTEDEQEIVNRTKLVANNEREASFHDVDVSSKCTETTTADISPGTGVEITDDCTRNRFSGDWIKVNTSQKSSDPAFSHDLGSQGVYIAKNLSEAGGYNWSNVSVSTPDINGSCENCGLRNVSLEGSESITEYYNASSDWIQNESESTTEIGQNTSIEATVDSQTLYNQTQLEVNNTRGFRFSGVDVSSRCSTTTSVDVPSGESVVTDACNNNSFSGDWIENEKNQSTEYVSGDIQFGEGLDTEYDAAQSVEVSNVRTSTDLQVDLNSLISDVPGCSLDNSSAQNVPADSVSQLEFQKSCTPGQHLNRTLVVKTETDDFYKYEIEFGFEIHSNLTEEEATEYAVESSWADNWNNRDPTETEALVDGSSKDIQIDERIINGTEYIIFVIGDQHTNSSIHEGVHSASLTYYEDKTPGSTSGGSSSSGSSTTLLGDGSETQVDEVTSDKYNWTLSAITSQDSQKFQVSGYPGATFERYVVVRNTGDRNVTLDIECVSIEDECSWVETSVDRVVLNRNDFTEKQVKVNGTVPPDFEEGDAPAQFSIRVSDPEFNGSQSGPHVAYVDFTVTNSPFLGRALDAAVKGLEVRTFESPVSWGHSVPYLFIFVPLFWSVLVNVLWSTGEWLVSLSDRNRQWSTNLKWISTIAVFFLTYILL